MLGEMVSGAFNLADTGLKYAIGKESRQDQWKKEQKVLKNQIQWRVQDAVAAGLHPLVGAGISPSAGPMVSPIDIGTGVSDMGANIGRAVDSVMRPQDKLAAKAALLDLEQRQANIDLTRAQLAGAQKALLTTGATPGIASHIPGNEPAMLGNIPIRDKNFGQKVENYMGDNPLAWLLSMGNALEDWARYNWTPPSVNWGSTSGYSRFPGGRNYR